MRPVDFALKHPLTWPEAAATLRQNDARPLSGSQSLGPMLNLRLAQPEVLIDLKALPDFSGISLRDDCCRIGAGTTHATIEDGLVPGRLGEIMASVARRIAYRAVRNRGTIGGSLAHADPAADWVSVLPVFPGEVVAFGSRGERRIPTEDFVDGIFSTALEPDELLQAIEIRILPEGTRWGHWKFCRKPGEFSKATACVLLCPDRPPRAVLAALDQPPLVMSDATALIANPEDEIERIIGSLDNLTPWRIALARTALRRAVEMVKRTS